MKNKTVVFSVEIDPSNSDQRKALNNLMDLLSAEGATATTEKEKTGSKAVAKETLTLEQLQAATKEKSAKFKDEIKKKLAALGADKVSTLAEDKYDEYYKFVTELGSAKAAAKTTLTREQLTKATSEKVGEFKEEIRTKLADLGAKSVSTLAEEKYDEYYKFVTELETL